MAVFVLGSFEEVAKMNKPNERVLCGDGACTGTLNEKGICNICGKSSKDANAEKTARIRREIKREKCFCGVCGKEVSYSSKVLWQGKTVPVCEKCWHRVKGKATPTSYLIRELIGSIVSTVVDFFILWTIAKSLEISFWYVVLGCVLIELYLWVKARGIGYVLFRLLLKNPTIDDTWRSLAEHNYPNPTKYGRLLSADGYFSNVMRDEELAIETRLDAAGAQGVISTFKERGFVFNWMMDGTIMKAIDKYHKTDFQGKGYEFDGC
jgi:hypothetical protein